MRNLALEGQGLEIAIVMGYPEGNSEVSGRVPRMRKPALEGQCLEIAIVIDYPKGDL